MLKYPSGHDAEPQPARDAVASSTCEWLKLFGECVIQVVVALYENQCIYHSHQHWMRFLYLWFSENTHTQAAVQAPGKTLNSAITGPVLHTLGRECPHEDMTCLTLCVCVCVSLLSILPMKQGLLLGQYLGAFNLMDTFKGRSKKQQWRRDGNGKREREICF